ncbi:RICIN domain-containing protein [Bacillus cereus]
MQGVKNELSKQGPVADGTYKIVAKVDSSKVLDNDFNHDRLSLLWNDNGGDNQKWILKYNKDKNAYKMISKKTSDELATNGQNDTVFATTDRRDNDERYWTLENAENGYFFIKNKASGKVLDVTNGKTDNGTVIKTHTQNTPAVAAQLFKLETAQ